MAKTNQYELTIVSRLNPKTKKGEDNLEKIKKTLVEIGKITKEENWGKKTLAYPIQKETAAYYCWFLFKAGPNKVGRLDNILKLNENIIRHLLVVVD
ncbi:MAG: 30S ribosomal protein S6 [Candidatus Shapirobacteria bacterium]|nr:30S ribosomal protein S6 [Candidatus Shapirobacteria bacterium]